MDINLIMHGVSFSMSDLGFGEWIWIQGTRRSTSYPFWSSSTCRYPKNPESRKSTSKSGIHFTYIICGSWMVYLCAENNYLVFHYDSWIWNAPIPLQLRASLGSQLPDYSKVKWTREFPNFRTYGFSILSVQSGAPENPSQAVKSWQTVG